jgi:hypothetical protein
MAWNFSGTSSTAKKMEGVGIGVTEAVGVGDGVGVEAGVAGANQNRAVIDMTRRVILDICLLLMVSYLVT